MGVKLQEVWGPEGRFGIQFNQIQWSLVIVFRVYWSMTNGGDRRATQETVVIMEVEEDGGLCREGSMRCKEVGF